MGGTNFEIPIVPDASALKRATIPKPSFLGKLFGLRSPAPPHGRCDDLLIRDREIEDLARRELQSFVHREIPEPWPATSTFLKAYPYLLKPAIGIQGARDDAGSPVGWSLAVRFPGCAGMAETSALLAVHWSEIWYARKSETLLEALRTRGLAPSGTPAPWSPTGMQFLPVGEYGYALFNREYQESKDPQDQPASAFELDESVMEVLGEECERVLRHLDEGFATDFADGRCRCQLCMPQFDVTQVDELLQEA